MKSLKRKAGTLRSWGSMRGERIFHLTAVFEEFKMLLTNMLALVFANVAVNIPLYKVFSDGK